MLKALKQMLVPIVYTYEDEGSNLKMGDSDFNERNSQQSFHLFINA